MIAFDTYWYSSDRATRAQYVTEQAMLDTFRCRQEARRAGRRAEAELWQGSLLTLRDIRRALVGRA